MQVADAFGSEPLDEQRSLGQIGEVVQQAAVGPARHRPGQPQGAEEARGPGQREAGGSEQHRSEAALQQVTRALALLAVDRVGYVVGPTTRRDAQHRDALTLEREDLAPDKAVAHLRVLVDQVGDRRRRGDGCAHLYSITAARRCSARPSHAFIWPSASGNLPATRKKARDHRPRLPRGSREPIRNTCRG